jgi:hypothetical protein
METVERLLEARAVSSTSLTARVGNELSLAEFEVCWVRPYRADVLLGKAP